MDPIHLELPSGLLAPLTKLMEVYCNPCKNLYVFCICIHEIIYIYSDNLSDNLSDLSMSKLRVTTEVMLRNPWGQKEWTGDYSDSSDRWGFGWACRWASLGTGKSLEYSEDSSDSDHRWYRWSENVVKTEFYQLRKFYSVKLLKSDWTLSTRCWFSTGSGWT